MKWQRSCSRIKAAADQSDPQPRVMQAQVSSQRHSTRYCITTAYDKSLTATLAIDRIGQRWDSLGRHRRSWKRACRRPPRGRLIRARTRRYRPFAAVD
eukprot:scaffold159485_cov29-Tisochrysis_lutea.AAC.3